MKIKLAVAVMISVVAIWGVGSFGVAIAGNLEARQTPVGDEGGVFSTDLVSLEPDAAAAPPARVEKTGQTTSYGPRDDGKLRKGVAWPDPRFMDNGNGTVRDNLTGLIWLKNAYCNQFYARDTSGRNRRGWEDALTAANKLASGYCGLTDESKAGQWRLPNVKELQSLIDFGFYFPALSNAAGTGQWTQGDAFLGVQPYYYWSSSSSAYYSVYAWMVYLYDGNVGGVDKSVPGAVWPVRGGL